MLDEPTNDLDAETLDLLEDALLAYPGTVLVVSHDRDFLDQTVTGLLVFDGNGDVREVVGGWTEWERIRPKTVDEAPRSVRAPKKSSPKWCCLWKKRCPLSAALTTYARWLPKGPAIWASPSRWND